MQRREQALKERWGTGDRYKKQQSDLQAGMLLEMVDLWLDCMFFLYLADIISRKLVGI